MIRELFLRDLSLWGCIWQSTLFAVIGLAGSFLFRRRPARASQVLFLAIIAAVLLPTMSMLIRHFGLGLFTEEPIVLTSFVADIPAESPGVFPSAEIQPAALEVPTDFALAPSSSGEIEIPWRLIALYGWMIAMLILLGRLFAAFVSGIRLLRRAQSGRCEHIRQAANAARARLGITKGLQIRSSEEVRSPMIWCWSRPPVLLVPGNLDGRIGWVDVICHELAHWRRWDHVSGFAAELAVCILPWNPLLWWSKKRMVRLSEQACDDWVLAGGRTGADYAQSLLNLSPDLQMAFMPTVIGKEKPMKKRIYRIVKEKCGVPHVGARWALVVTIIAASVTVGVALAQRRQARLESPQRDERPAAEQRERQVLKERMADLKGQAHELKARFDEVKTELAKLEDSGKGESDEAQAHRAELRELEKAIAPIERELQGLEGELRSREMRPGAGQEPRREILRRLEELGHETELVLQSLADQRISRSEETNVLYGRMRELNEQMQQVRQQLGRQLEGPGRQRPELENLERERGRRRPVRELRREEHPEAIMQEREELKEKARQIEAELEQLGGENPERAEKLHAELREIHEAIAQIEREPGSSRERVAERQVRLRELQEQARELERRLQELGDSHPEEAQELRMQLDQIHGQIERIEREPDLPERPWPRVENPMQPGGEFHRQELMVRREQLQTQLKELELVLRELNQQGKAESEEAQMHKQQLRELQEQLQATENEIRQSEPGRAQEPGRNDLEREVQDLRKQIDSINGQMGEMRELMKRLLEKGEPSEAR
jgi:beta-lactamase regulating signal transducer with metallopeptidase domain/chromosome segregation ATPase